MAPHGSIVNTVDVERSALHVHGGFSKGKGRVLKKTPVDSTTDRQTAARRCQPAREAGAGGRCWGEQAEFAQGGR